MSEQTQPGTALQALAEKLRTDAIAIFGEGQAERDIIEWFYAALLAAAPAQPAVQGEFADAYQGAREDLAIWKRRALEAEEKLRNAEQSTPAAIEVIGYASPGQVEILRKLPRTGGMKVKGCKDGRYTEPVVLLSVARAALFATVIRCEQAGAFKACMECGYQDGHDEICKFHSSNRAAQDQGEVQRLRDWIACAERLPADKRDVMVYCADSDEHMVGSSIGDGLFLFATASNGEKVVCRPTHWRYIDESDKPDLAASTGQERGEVQRLREALERATKLLSAAAGYATKMEPMPAKLLNAIDAELDASTGQEVWGE